jgi:hypothetical protein
MVRDGLWRATTEDDIKTAWEESVRLREKMFWSRLGGGVVPAIGRDPSPTGTQRRTDARSLRRNSTETSIPRLSRDSVESVRSKALEVPRLNDPRPPSRNNSRSTANISDGSTTSLQTSESSDTRDFADAQTDVDNTVDKPMGLAIDEHPASDLDSVNSQTPRLGQEDGPHNDIDQSVETGLPAIDEQKQNHAPSVELEKEEQASVTNGEEEAPIDKSLQPEMPGSFD